MPPGRHAGSTLSLCLSLIFTLFILRVFAVVTTAVRSSNTCNRKRQAAPAVFLPTLVVPGGHLETQIFGLKDFPNIQVYPEPRNYNLI